MSDEICKIGLHLLRRDHFNDKSLNFSLEVLHLTLLSEDVVVRVQDIFLDASTLQAFAELFKDLFI